MLLVDIFLTLVESEFKGLLALGACYLFCEFWQGVLIWAVGENENQKTLKKN